MHIKKLTVEIVVIYDTVLELEGRVWTKFDDKDEKLGRGSKNYWSSLG